MRGVIKLFLEARKEKWLGSKLKPQLTDKERARYQAEADEKFDPENWLPNAAHRDG